MDLPTHPTQIQRMLQHRLKLAVPTKPVLAATLVEVQRVCGKPSCRCAKGHKHHAVQFTCKVRGKTRSVYVPVDLREEVRSWIEEHRRLKQVLAEIHHLTVALVRTHVRQKRRRRGRP